VLDEIFSTAFQLRDELISDVPADDLETCARVLTHIRAKAEIESASARGGASSVSKLTKAA
jgi:hypothetical protein